MLCGWVENSPLYDEDSKLIQVNGKYVAMQRVMNNHPRCFVIDTEKVVDTSNVNRKTAKEALDFIFNETIEENIHYGVALEFGYTGSKSAKYIQDFLGTMIDSGRSEDIIRAYSADNKKDLLADIADAIELGILVKDGKDRSVSFKGGRKALASYDKEAPEKSMKMYSALISHLLSEDGEGDLLKLKKQLESLSAPLEETPGKGKGKSKPVTTGNSTSEAGSTEGEPEY
jgi:hypothetical protein